MSTIQIDEVRVAAPRSRPALPSWSVGIIAALALLGLVVGAAIGAARQPEPSVTVQILINPDPALPLQFAPSTVDDVDRFVQTEVLVLGGPDLGAEAGELLSLSETPEVDVIQVANTSVVAITATAATEQAAERAADGLVQAYQARRRDGFGMRVARVSDTVNNQLSGLEASLSALSGPTGDDSALRSALSAEYGRLIATRNELQLGLAVAEDLAPVVQRPVAADTSVMGAAVRLGLLGLLLGLIVGALAVLARRQLAHR